MCVRGANQGARVEIAAFLCVCVCVCVCVSVCLRVSSCVRVCDRGHDRVCVGVCESGYPASAQETSSFCSFLHISQWPKKTNTVDTRNSLPSGVSGEGLVPE